MLNPPPLPADPRPTPPLDLCKFILRWFVSVLARLANNIVYIAPGMKPSTFRPEPNMVCVHQRSDSTMVPQGNSPGSMDCRHNMR